MTKMWPLLAALLALPVQRSAEVNSIPWVTSFAEGMRLPKKTHKPMIVDFCADWCVLCHDLDKKTYTDAKVKRMFKSYIPIKLDVALKVNRPAVDWYGIDPLPTILVLDSNGKVLHSMAGFFPPDEFIAQVKKSSGRTVGR